MDNGTTRRILLRNLFRRQLTGERRNSHAGGFQRPALSLAQYGIETTRSLQIQYRSNDSIEFFKLQGKIQLISRENFTIISGLYLKHL